MNNPTSLPTPFNEVFEEIKGIKEYLARHTDGVHIDTRTSPPHPSGMNDAPTRAEIEAKLEAQEARTEARFSDLHRQAEVRFTKLEGRVDAVATSVQAVASELHALRTDIKDLRGEVGGLRETSRTTRLTILAAVVATALGLWGVVASTQSGLLAAFQTGIAAQPHASSPPAQP